MTPRTGFMFWNLQDQPLTQSIANLVGRFDPEVILLAESPYWADPNVILARLNVFPPAPGEKEFVHVSATTALTEKRIQVFSRKSRRKWKLLKQRKHYAIWRLSLQFNYLILVTAHFPAFQEDQGDEQRAVAIMLRSDLKQIEPHYTSSAADGSTIQSPTLLIGDLNANPFDPGVVGVYGLNATAYRSIAEQRDRVLHGESHPYFFNPMWQFYSGHGEKVDTSNPNAFTPPGTFFYSSSKNKPIWFGWHLLDQVLLRPSLFDAWDNHLGRKIAIPAHDGVVWLMTDEGKGSPGGTRKAIRYSDHLPLIAELAI